MPFWLSDTGPTFHFCLLTKLPVFEPLIGEERLVPHEEGLASNHIDPYFVIMGNAQSYFP